MKYNPHVFVSGDVLTADQMNTLTAAIKQAYDRGRVPNGLTVSKKRNGTLAIHISKDIPHGDYRVVAYSRSVNSGNTTGIWVKCGDTKLCHDYAKLKNTIRQKIYVTETSSAPDGVEVQTDDEGREFYYTKFTAGLAEWMADNEGKMQYSWDVTHNELNEKSNVLVINPKTWLLARTKPFSSNEWSTISVVNPKNSEQRTVYQAQLIGTSRWKASHQLQFKFKLLDSEGDVVAESNEIVGIGNVFPYAATKAAGKCIISKNAIGQYSIKNLRVTIK